MTPQALRRKIKGFEATPPVTLSFEKALTKQGTWSTEGVWYRSQKEHWLGWLAEYDGPGAYGRKTTVTRSAEFAYNHVVCPPMVLWLGEASGVKRSLVNQAKKAGLEASRKLQGKCAAIRKIVPWSKNCCEPCGGFHLPHLSRTTFLRGAMKLTKITGSVG